MALVVYRASIIEGSTALYSLRKAKTCPVCHSNKHVKYHGISVESSKLEKLFSCKNRYEHVENRYVYYVARVRTEVPIDKHKDHEKRTDEEKDQRRTDLNNKYDMYTAIDEESFVKRLSQRVKCPRHQEHVDQTDDTEYKFVNVKGNGNRFYCRGHKDKRHSVYEFRATSTKRTFRLKKLLEQISEDLLARLRKIHDNNQVYDVKIDKEGLVDYLLSIKLSTYIIARLFHTTQNKIYNIKKKREERYIATVRKASSAPSSKSKNSSVFMLTVELTSEDYMRIVLNENYNPPSKKKKKITPSPHSD